MPCSMGDMEIERAVSFNVTVSPTLPAAMQSDPVATWHLRNMRREVLIRLHPQFKYHCPNSYEFSAVLRCYTIQQSSLHNLKLTISLHIRYRVCCKRIEIHFQFESQMQSCV